MMASTKNSSPLLPMTTTSIDSPPAEEKVFKGSAMTKRGAYAAISYMSCAVLLVLFNKAALSSYNFPSANVITLCQIICSCCFLYLLRRLKLISFHLSEFLSTPDNFKTFVPLKTLIDTLPVAVTYLLYMLVTMESVRGVNVPMYTTLRRTTVVFTMIVESILASQKYSRPIIGSVVIIVFGAFVAGARDLSFDFYGYAVVFLSNITTAIYLATIARIGKSSGLNSFGLMWCNGIVCGPFLLVWSLIRGDLALTMDFPYLFSPGFLDLFTISLGWFIFGGLPFDLLNVLGQLLGFVGSGLYAYYKLIGK
ncbi:UDP-N-acetylglucosamine transporter UGNT1-like isoform X2 [Lycium barbarum]|uniref:UDP-N-acetylglucosamine transporter UGNT1-like isoform X2 n=1 Tax=Lycium barbarum TaxID=112863 RepID=UPI00293F0F03|nr:UDP-N-acetylglucosamine transporter UGNT1-like isoform X2 [Lycium barbarum]